MLELLNNLSKIDNSQNVEKAAIINEVLSSISNSNYEIKEINDQMPWGAFFRFANENADDFIHEFFPDLDPVAARRGKSGMELSPKILLVSPNHRLSWQYHNRRAERWMFLTDGAYHKSHDDNMSDLILARAGDSVQFGPSERHRLVGRQTHYCFVAEIWQHTDNENQSDENDTIRLQDDYKR